MGLGLDCGLGNGAISTSRVTNGDNGIAVHVSCRGARGRGIGVGNGARRIGIPFLVLSNVVLSGSGFGGIRISGNGTVGSNAEAVITNFTLPNVRSDLSVSGSRVRVPSCIRVATSAASFRLSAAVAITVGSVFGSISFSGISSGISRLGSSLSRLRSTTRRLISNSSRLCSNVNALLSGSNALVRNVSGLCSNTRRMGDNTGGLSDNTSNLSGNTGALSSNTSGLGDNTSGLSDNTSRLSDNLTALTNNTSRISGNTTDLDDCITALTNNLNGLSSGDTALGNNTRRIFGALLSATSARVTTTNLATSGLAVGGCSDILRKLVSSLDSRGTRGLTCGATLRAMATAMGDRGSIVEATIRTAMEGSIARRILTTTNLNVATSRCSTTITTNRIDRRIRTRISATISARVDASTIRTTVSDGATSRVRDLVRAGVGDRRIGDRVRTNITGTRTNEGSLRTLGARLSDCGAFCRNILSCATNISRTGRNTRRVLTNACALGSNANSLMDNTNRLGGNSSDLGDNADRLGDNASALGSNASDLGDNMGALGGNADSLSGNAGSLFRNINALGSNDTTLISNIGRLGSNTVALSGNVGGFGRRNVSNVISTTGNSIQSVVSHFGTIRGTSGGCGGCDNVSSSVSNGISFVCGASSVRGGWFGVFGDGAGNLFPWPFRARCGGRLYHLT